MKISKWMTPEWFPIMRGIEFIGVLTAIFVFMWEFAVERPIDRAVRRATLFAQMAQTHALKDGAGLKALRPTILALLDEGIPIEGQILIRVDLSGADLREAHLPRSDLTRADLRDANLTGAILVGAVLWDANIRRADLTDADLTNANLLYANLTDANLTDANLTDAYLTRANLTGANLTGADLTRADLEDANLQGANLRRANLADANYLTRDQLDSACIEKDGKPPILPEGMTPPSNICPER